MKKKIYIIIISMKSLLKSLIIPIGAAVVLFALWISIPVGFAFVIGLCVGSLFEKSGLNN